MDDDVPVNDDSFAMSVGRAFKTTDQRREQDVDSE